MQYSPKSITVQESAPDAVDHIAVRATNLDMSVNYATANYPLTGTTTVIPIGSNSFFTPGPALDTEFRLFVWERSKEGHGPDPVEQEVPGGPFTLTSLVDGADGITIQL